MFAVDGRSATKQTLAAIDSAALTEEFQDTGYDKVFLGGLSLAGSQWSIAAREWDAAGQSMGPVHSASTFDLRNLPALTADVIQQAFRPVARIELVEGNLVVTSIRAGEFPPGSMGPKIEAAINFLQAGGKEVIITSIGQAYPAVLGKAGTHVLPD